MLSGEALASHRGNLVDHGLWRGPAQATRTRGAISHPLGAFLLEPLRPLRAVFAQTLKAGAASAID
jgi:hypothetical protein